MKSLEATEALTPLIIEDFEIGNRVYFLNHKQDRLDYGTVTNVVEDRLEVVFDGFYRPVMIHISQFGSNAGRCFDINAVEVGSVVSALSKGERFYADVTEYIPNEKLTIKYRSDGTVVTFCHTARNHIEFQMDIFTIEG
jgi:hypothetical protein